MKKILMMVTALMLLCSCTMFSRQLDLEHGLTEPTPLSQVNVTITEMGFLEGGWACCEREGIPKALHPVIIQVFGCADVYIENGKVVRCDVILGTSSNFIREHELKHCEGYID